MEGKYHGYALGKDAFFANSESDVFAEFEKKASCEVRKCVYPVRSERVYCISENGDLFGMIHDERKHIFIGMGPYNKHVLHAETERPTPGAWYNVKHYLTGKDTVVRAEKLVYCTFVLGEWNDEVKVEFKDGDQYNIALSNLTESKETFSPIWTAHMTEQAQVYKREFNRVVDYVSWFCGIRQDEAQDCAQDTFMWLTNNNRTMPIYFIGAWMFWSKMNGMHYVRDRARMCHLEDWDGWREAKIIDIDILGLVKNEKHRDMLQMKLNGYTNKEIADKYGTTAGTVQYTVSRVLNNLRDYFAKDFKAMGIERQYGNRCNIFG